MDVRKIFAFARFKTVLWTIPILIAQYVAHLQLPFSNLLYSRLMLALCALLSSRSHKGQQNFLEL
jgi:hypothetical protein